MDFNTLPDLVANYREREKEREKGGMFSFILCYFNLKCGDIILKCGNIILLFSPDLILASSDARSDSD